MNFTYPTILFRYIPTIKKIRHGHTKRLLTRLRNHDNKKTDEAGSLLKKIDIVVPNQQNHSPSDKITTTIDVAVKTPETKGMEQYAKDVIVKSENDKHKIDELIRKSNRSIFSVSSIFPWNFFPDSIDVEESRVTIIFRQLFASQSHSIDIKDISNVFIESGFFFSTLQIVSRTYIQNEIKIEYLRKNDAMLIKDIIEGLRTFAHHDINTTNYEIEELIDKLHELNASKS